MRAQHRLAPWSSVAVTSAFARDVAPELVEPEVQPGTGSWLHGPLEKPGGGVTNQRQPSTVVANDVRLSQAGTQSNENIPRDGAAGAPVRA